MQNFSLNTNSDVTQYLDQTKTAVKTQNEAKSDYYNFDFSLGKPYDPSRTDQGNPPKFVWKTINPFQKQSKLLNDELNLGKDENGVESFQGLSEAIQDSNDQKHKKKFNSELL